MKTHTKLGFSSMDTAEMVTTMNSMIRELEKEHWMLTAWLNESRKEK